MMHQTYFVSVSEAIRAGRLNLRTIPSIVAFGGLAFYFLLFFDAFGVRIVTRQFNPALLFLIPVSSLIFAFIWRSFHTAAWKIWALENVQDVHRLYQVALSQGMINKPDSWLIKLEYKTADQRQRLANLETRLDQPRQMEEPSSTLGIGEPREFPYSLNRALLEVIMCLPVFVIIYFVTGKFEFFPFGLILIVLIGFMLFRWLPRIGKPAPIRFDAATLRIKDNPPLAWRDITNIYVEKKSDGERSETVLVVETNTTPARLDLQLSELVGRSDEIEQTLYNYWVQGKK